MGAFTTNWYLYKAYSHPIFKESQTSRNKIATETCRSNRRTKFKPKNREIEIERMNFEEALLEAIDEGLSLLGESSKKAVYFHLEKAFEINRETIPHKIEDFVSALEKIFGTGAKIVEIQIMKCLFKKVGCNFTHYPQKKSLTFIEYIAAVKLEKENYEKLIDGFFT